MDHPATDTAIVGAGPVGLLIAILLGRAGHNVTVVERWPQIYDRPRAVTMDAEVARILASIGIDVDTDPDFENHKELYYWKNADLEPLQIVDWESLAPCGWHVTYWFNQPSLEARLERMLAQYPNVRLLRGWTVDGLRQSDDAATLTLRRTDGAETQTLHAAYVVGADGANSFVRHALDLPMTDEGYFFDWLILDMIPAPDYRVSPAQWQLCDPARPTTIVPGGPGRRRWEFMVLPGEDSTEIATTESAWRLLEPWGLTPDNATLERSAVYRFQARWADRWSRGRCFIAGDAAHLMPPFAGEGMCAGLRDAVALAWRLDGVLSGDLPPQALASYESERKPHAKHYIDFSRALGDIICVTDPAAAAERDATLKRDLEARNHAPITGDLVSLGPGAWCQGSATAGDLSPQGIVSAHGTTGRFDQVVAQGWTLIELQRSAAEAAPPPLSSALNIRHVTVGPAGSGAAVTTHDAAYADWFGAADAQFALIRPDFYTAATARSAATMAQHIAAIENALGL